VKSRFTFSFLIVHTALNFLQKAVPPRATECPSPLVTVQSLEMVRQRSDSYTAACVTLDVEAQASTFIRSQSQFGASKLALTCGLVRSTSAGSEGVHGNSSCMDIGFLTISPHSEKWTAFNPNSVKARFIESSKTAAVVRAIPVARQHKWALVCKDGTGRAVGWLVG
jgi:hypothetical protein